MRLLTIVGARPQFVKAAVISRELRRRGHHETLVHTGQHYDTPMSAVFFAELQIEKPTFNLGAGSGRHGAQTGRMMESLEDVMIAAQPEAVIIYGDTNSTLAGALVAAKLHMPLAHVEAGLRSFNRRMPEEVNRIVADQLSDILFAPTDVAAQNLLNEGVGAERIIRTGDVMYDAALHAGAMAKQRPIVKLLGLENEEFILATIHRAENTDSIDRLRAIAGAIVRLATKRRVVLPLHPRTRGAMESAHIDIASAPGVLVLEPVGYFDMVALEQSASLILTDSGGVQKEAYFHGVPCVTTRNETEWVELLSTRWNRLAPPDSADGIVRIAEDALGDTLPEREPLYGDGNAASYMIARLEEHWATTN